MSQDKKNGETGHWARIISIAVVLIGLGGNAAVVQYRVGQNQTSIESIEKDVDKVNTSLAKIERSLGRLEGRP